MLNEYYKFDEMQCRDGSPDEITHRMLKAFRAMSRYKVDHRAMPALATVRCSSSDSSSPKPKAVIFDMGGVVVPSPFQLFKDFEKSTGLSSGTVSKFIVAGGMDGAWSQLESGKLTLSEFSDIFSRELSKEVGKEIDTSLLIAWMSKSEEGHAFPVMVNAVRGVKAHGMKTALLTNNWFVDELKTKTLLPVDQSLFDVVVQSCVLGYRKPHTNMYSRCVQELHVNANEAVFLDDLGHNLKPAQAMGMHTIKVTSPEQAVAELESLLGISLSGEVPGTTEVPKRLLLDEGKLENYLKSLGLEDTNPPFIRVFEHGQSNPTYFVSYGGRRMVLRKKPPGKLLPSAHAVDREFKVMSAVQKGGVPVPNMIAFCDDVNVAGTPFYLMDYVHGAVYKELELPEMTSQRKRDTVMAMVDVLVKIHTVDVDAVGLSDYGKKGQYMERNFKRWASQYELSKTREIPAMTKLMEWLPHNFPKDEKVTVVHGDFRIDNLMYHPDRPEVLATLDWELSTLGDPISDLATACLAYFLPRDNPLLPGLKGCDPKELGLPTVDEVVAEYCRLSGRPPIENWDFYLAFVFFRMAAILQGVYKRAITGQSSSSTGEAVGAMAEEMANFGWEIASQGPPNSSPIGAANTSANNSTGSGQRRHFSTLMGHRRPVMSTLVRPYSTSGGQGTAGQMAVNVQGLSPRVQDLHRRVKEFIQEHVVPLELVRKQREESGAPRWEVMPELEAAKEKAKAAGLWNLFLPVESDPGSKYGAGLTNLEYAFLCEEMGKCFFAPEVFNCSAPDTGNMETIVRYGTEEQKEKWLRPLLDGKIRSCFAMTEPAVASSDATNIESSISRDGDSYIINGHKWWTSGALDPRCKICIFMGKTDKGEAKHRQQSMILVPMDSPGITIVRPLKVFGYDDAPEGHGEVIFDNVRVPASNILLGEGRGFEIAQGRLGPGRIHHCMRLIGNAERALSLMVDRTMKRVAFGKPLAAQGTIQQDVARSRIEIEQCRLLVLKAAYMMDLYGNKVAAPEIAMIKVAAPNMALSVIDRAIQAHGGAGVSEDFPLAFLYAAARTLRFADGPDEVHQRAVARIEYAKIAKAKI
ncbi:acyl-CoA dehydrogenase family member 10 isoform X2 [Aplysia californica]|uniref:Acyl-CoA dehydrogenase family member 10 isoform X2 n=1 Tax=Aplysia californica TaxID=6500 RepID=A0ABM0JVS1_APLCA|nr:acyl-CoA dehydrogenase family member 10 isoform X2 [Aplysia californica]